MSLVEYDLRVIVSLLNEVVDLVRSEDFLSGRADCDQRDFIVGGLEYSWQVREPTHYIERSDINNEDTAYLTLENSIMHPIKAMYIRVHSCGLCEIDDAVSNLEIEVSELIDASPRVVELGHKLCRADSTCDDPEILISHVRTTMSRHFAAMMECRALTASKRYPPLELLFNAYQAGLYPYGWDWDIDGILCVRP